MEKGNTKSPNHNLAFHFLLAFKLKDPVTIDTLCNQMMKEKVNAGDLWEWYERLTISDER